MPHVNMLEANLAVLLIIDIQSKMLAAIGSSSQETILDKTRRLIGTAKVLDIPILLTEQNPQGIGSTDSRVQSWLPDDLSPIEKTTCSCWRDEKFKRALQATGREHVILAGLETHVCVQQTALDLLRVDYVPFLAADAVGSRTADDMKMSLERMRHAGVEVSTAEAIIFDLIERCDHPKFKEILKLVK